MGQTWFQNRSIEIEIVRSDRFRDPIALTIAVQKFLRRAFVTLFWPLHAIIIISTNSHRQTNNIILQLLHLLKLFFCGLSWATIRVDTSSELGMFEKFDRKFETAHWVGCWALKKG